MSKSQNPSGSNGNGANGNGANGNGRHALPQLGADPIAGLTPIDGFPSSEKVYVEHGELRVPARRIHLSGDAGAVTSEGWNATDNTKYEVIITVPANTDWIGETVTIDQVDDLDGNTSSSQVRPLT